LRLLTSGPLAFCDWTVEHRFHLQTVDAVESVFAAVRRGIARTKGLWLQPTAGMIVFRSVPATLKTGRWPTSQNWVSKVVAGLSIRNGAEILSALTHNLAESAHAEIRYNSQRGRERRVAEP
jgi:hypothetical protein